MMRDKGEILKNRKEETKEDWGADMAYWFLVVEVLVDIRDVLYMMVEDPRK